MTTAKKMQAAAENGNMRLAQAPVATDADLFSGRDALMPSGKTADIVHWSHSGYHVRDALGAARNDPRAIEAGLHAAVDEMWAALDQGQDNQTDASAVKDTIAKVHAAISSLDISKMESLWFHNAYVMLVNPKNTSVSVGWDDVKKNGKTHLTSGRV
jgi:hypothetical protein